MRLIIFCQMADCGGLPQVVQVGFCLSHTSMLSSNFLRLTYLLTFILLSFRSQGNLLRPSSTLFREWATVSKPAHVYFSTGG